MKKAMISQPMANKSKAEIVEARVNANVELLDKGYDTINTHFTDPWHNSEELKDCGVLQIPLYYLAKSLEIMAVCHIVYFCKGWEKARGCRIEHAAAVAYGLERLYEGEEA